jgi:hypothetical protein
MTTCAQCKKPIGWHAENKTAAFYEMADGPVALCSAKCRIAWQEKRAKEAAKQRKAELK